MSADRWSRCPQCYKRGTDALDAQEAHITSSYGVVPVADFDDMREALASARKDLEEAENTFREDYWFSRPDMGEIGVSYKGYCTRCGLRVEFQSEHPIPGL